MRYFTWEITYAVEGGEGTTPETFIPVGYLNSGYEYESRKILGYGDEFVNVEDGAYWNLQEITLEEAWLIINKISTKATLNADGKFEIPMPLGLTQEAATI